MLTQNTRSIPLSTPPFLKNTINHIEAKTYPSGTQIPNHAHSAIELYRIISGECLVTIYSDTIHCAAGDLIMILPEVIHAVSVDEAGDCSLLHLQFDPKIFSETILTRTKLYDLTLLHAVLFSFPLYYHRQTDQTIDRTLDDVSMLCSKHTSSFSTTRLNMSLINLLLHLLADAPGERLYLKSPLKTAHILFTLNYICENYSHDFQLADIAKELDITMIYLRSIFRQAMQTSLQNYINVYRINRSIELMQQTDYSLTKIALSVGFADSQQYTKLFTRFIGTKPSNYQKKLQKREWIF